MLKKKILNLSLIVLLATSCATTKSKPIIVKPVKPACSSGPAMAYYKNWIYNVFPSLPAEPKPKLPTPTRDQLLDIIFCVIEYEQLPVFN